MVLQVSQRSLLHLDSAGIGLDKPLSGQNLTHKIMTMAITRFCPDKASLSIIYSVVIKYMYLHVHCSSIGIYSQAHRASIAQSYTKEGHFIPSVNGGPDGKHSCQVCS